MGAALGYDFLGSSDTTDLLQDPSSLADRRWTQLPWSLPESTLAACWWLTKSLPEDRKDAPDCDFSARPKLLCRSFGVLWAELDQRQVAPIANVRSERQRRRNRNTATALLLKQNPLWNKAATAEQLSAIRNISATSQVALSSWVSTADVSCFAKRNAETEELCRIPQKLQRLLQSLDGEQKHNLHRDMFI